MQTACLVEPRIIADEQAEILLGRPLSQLTDPAAFTWDVRLALQLLAHTGKIKALNIPTNNTEFWERYLTLLPTPESLCQV
jgi:hypothetical protein